MVQEDAASLTAKFAGEQVEKWKVFRAGVQKRKAYFPVITLSMAPGSGGSFVAEAVAGLFGFDYFHRKLIEVMSIDAKVNTQVLERLEQQRFSGVQDLISQVIDNRYLYPGLYLEHLEKVVQTIGRRGRAVIVGRGGNFILPEEKRLSIRVVSPLETRIRQVAENFDVLPEEAEKRVVNRQSKRAAFVKKNFNKDITDPVFYDLTVNTGAMSIEATTRLVADAYFQKFFDTV
jgi:chloramphenicol 3-O-phosphotransferase